MNKIVGNKIYICSTLLLWILIYLLNFCSVIYQCALVFTMITIMANLLTFIYGKSKSLKIAAFAIVINFALLWKLPYYIDGKIVNSLVFASFSSLIISMYWSTSVFQELTSRRSVIISNALSLILAAIIDSVVMSLFFILNNHFSYSKVLYIFSRELSYKITYIFIASAIMFVVLRMFKISRKLQPKLIINYDK